MSNVRSWANSLAVKKQKVHTEKTASDAILDRRD